MTEGDDASTVRVTDDGRPLGLVARGLAVADGVALVTGDGVRLRGRTVVSDPKRARALLPTPSEDCVRRIEQLGKMVRRLP